MRFYQWSLLLALARLLCAYAAFKLARKHASKTKTLLPNGSDAKRLSHYKRSLTTARRQPVLEAIKL